MADKVIFLSHIHEEVGLARLIKESIEYEFGGFVDVFVSSDGETIPSGVNFLKRIEDGLTNCVCSLYLISQISVSRNWINFELGAVWIRNAMNIRDGKSEIPTIPFCHSGISPSSLPVPLNVLSGISANRSDQLVSAFYSMQNAVGGRGVLKTNFDTLAASVTLFEKDYTSSKKILELFEILGVNRNQVKIFLEQNLAAPVVSIEGIVEHHRVGDFRKILSSLSGLISFEEGAQTSVMVLDENGRHRRTGISYRVNIDRKLIS